MDDPWVHVIVTDSSTEYLEMFVVFYLMQRATFLHLKHIYIHVRFAFKGMNPMYTAQTQCCE